MRGPCMCGDPFCPFCGPAQGIFPENDDIDLDEIEVESPFYDYSSRKWFFYNEDGKAVGPYDDKSSAQAGLDKYILDLYAEDQN